MTKLQRRLVNAIYTANQNSSDHGSGLGLLSLGTTRKIHSEDHRQSCINDINDSLRYCRETIGMGMETEDLEVLNDIPMLESLLELVERAPVGVEWISDADNMRYNEILFAAEKLGVPPKDDSGVGNERRYPKSWLVPTTKDAKMPTEIDACDLDECLDGYIMAALFTTNDDDDTEGDRNLAANYDRDDIDPKAIEEFTATCRQFLVDNADDVAELVRMYEAREWYTHHDTPTVHNSIGFNLWMEQNGTGSGFQDGDYPEGIEDRLHESAGTNEVHIYPHEGKLYI